MNLQEMRESLRPYMSNAEIDAAIKSLHLEKQRERERYKRQTDTPQYHNPKDLPDLYKRASIILHDRINAVYGEIPHGPVPKSGQVLQAVKPEKQYPCFRCAAARSCDCA